MVYIVTENGKCLNQLKNEIISNAISQQNDEIMI